MDKKIAGLLGAVGALASLNGAQAATGPADPAAVLKAQCADKSRQRTAGRRAALPFSCAFPAVAAMTLR
jgi:hypothetical protein